MKKGICIMLCAVLALSCTAIPVFGAERVIDATGYSVSSGVTRGDGYVVLKNSGSYIGFDDVDLTGIRSVSVVADSEIAGGDNGDSYMIKIGNFSDGENAGYIAVHDQRTESKTYGANLKKSVSGTKRLILQSVYGNDSKIKIKKIILSDNAVEENAPVPESAVRDNYSDTWTASDALGRKIADFEETGGVKDGTHEVGMFYWINFISNGRPGSVATLQSEIIRENPDAYSDYDHPAWPESNGYSGAYFWGEPLLGYYDSMDYWTYRRHAEMLADAGVDVILFDWSNGQQVMWNSLSIVASAFADAKAAGVNVPKFSCLGPWGGGNLFMKALYTSIICVPEYEALWYKWDGKYLVMNPSKYDSYVSGSDAAMDSVMQEIAEKFTYRSNGYRGSGDEVIAPSWNWLQNYPQTKWNKTGDGRVEAMPLGTAINHSYVYNYEDNGVFSDPFTKGRSYTEGFGEDYREGAKNYGYFFREQMSRVLDCDPAIVLVDGWNEWQNGRQRIYSGFENAFVDTFDEENSRDIEPSAGSLRDDYYMLLVDFIRKYKGVRKAPVASGEKTVNIAGGISEWDSVGPEYINAGGTYERDYYGFVNKETGDNFHYTTSVNNTITTAKVARDGKKFYFMAACEKDIVKADSFMHLYLNTDRNYATGWEGYDYSVNVTGEGELAEFAGGAWRKIANVEMNVSGKYLTLAVSRPLIGKSTDAELEFKWADGANEEDGILRLYQFGNTAPHGRFNYLYTDKEQKSLDNNIREILKGTSVLKAGSSKMNVSGGKMNVYDPDTRIAPIEEDGTLYIPLVAAEEILGYGRTKTEYYGDLDLMYVKNEWLTEENEVAAKWTYTFIGSNELRVNGRLKTLSKPCKKIDGMVYIPITYFSDAFDWNIVSLGDGAYAVSEVEADITAAKSALALL